MANFTDKQIADVADSQFIEAPHEAELLKEIIPSLMTKVNALENSEPVEMTAENVSFDDSETQLPNEPANVQEAIESVLGILSEVDASHIPYDNETSSLVAEDVQAAIDEVYAAIPEVPTEYTADDVSYENAAIPEVTEVAGALDAVVDIIRGDILTAYEITVQNTESTGSSPVNTSLIGGRIISIVPVSGAESAVAGASIDGTGVITITLVEAQAAGDAVFSVYCQKLVPGS